MQNRNLLWILVLLFGVFTNTGAQTIQDNQSIKFVTSSNNQIVVEFLADEHAAIYYNGKLIYNDTTHDFIFPNPINRFIEGKKGVSLFLLADGSPNFDRIVGYQITKNKATLKAESCFYGENGRKDGPAPFTDMDRDGYLEFGGFDITEVPPSYPDSVYCNPSEFYEIRDGVIFFDKELTIKKDIEKNGLYIKHPLDMDRFCCVVIPNPKLKKDL